MISCVINFPPYTWSVLGPGRQHPRASHTEPGANKTQEMALEKTPRVTTIHGSSPKRPFRVSKLPEHRPDGTRDTWRGHYRGTPPQLMAP